MNPSNSAPAIPFPVAAESPARTTSNALSLSCNQPELKCSHIHLHSRLVPKSSQCVLGRVRRLSATKHTGTMSAIWPYCKVQAVYLLRVLEAEASWDLQESLTLQQGSLCGRDLKKIHIYTYGCAKRSSLGWQCIIKNYSISDTKDKKQENRQVEEVLWGKMWH